MKQQSSQTPQQSQITRIGTQTNASDFTQDDIKKFRDLLSKGIEPERAKKLILQVKEQGQPQTGINTGIGGVVEGAVSQGPAFVSNVASFFPKTLSKGAGFVGEKLGVEKENNPFYTSGMGDAERLKQFGEASKQAIKKFGIEVDDTTAQKIGEELTSLAGSTLIAPGIGLEGKATQLLSKTPKLVKYGKGAVQGAEAMAKYDIAKEGTVKSTDVALGAGLGVAVPLAGAGIKGVKNYLTKSAPASLQLKGLLNPAKLTQVTDTLIQEGQKSPENVAKWMLDRGIKGGKETIISKLEQRATASRKAVDDTLKVIDKKTLTKYKNPEIDKALEQTYKDIESVSGMEAKAKEIRGLLSKGEYTLTEANRAKRILDEQYNLYKMSGGETSGIKVEGLRNIRQKIRKFIEDKASQNGAKNIKLLNNETAVAKNLSIAIGKKDSADYVRELLSPFAGSAVGGVIAGGANVGPFKGDDLLSRVGNVMAGALIGKGLTSTYVKTNVASWLNSLTPKELGALDAYIKSGGKAKLEKELESKVASKIKGLLPAEGQSSYIAPKKPAIITPQTKEKAIIQESKLPLKKTKYGTTESNLSNKSNTSTASNSSISNNKLSNNPSLINTNSNKLLPKETPKPLKPKK